jgi:hypothetical protein
MNYKDDKFMMKLYKQIHEELERERRENKRIIKHNEIVVKELRKLGYIK